MQQFHFIVISCALVIFILVLTYMSIMMSYAAKTAAFPPSANVCPDTWTFSADTSACIIGAAGTNGGSPVLTASTPNVQMLNGKMSLLPFSSAWGSSGQTAVCAKKKWALQNGVAWDGVANYNAC
jgi:hypothetical protein